MRYAASAYGQCAIFFAIEFSKQVTNSKNLTEKAMSSISMAMAPLRGSSLLSSLSGGEGICCLGAKGLAIPPKASANVAAPTLVLVLAAEEDTDDLGANAAVDERRVAATLRAATDLELTSMIVIGKLLKESYRLWRIANCSSYELFFSHFFSREK